MKLRSDAVKTIALASSSERPRRPNGTVVTSAALFSGVPAVGRGATTFTRIPALPISSATDLIRPSTACLLTGLENEAASIFRR